MSMFPVLDKVAEARKKIRIAERALAAALGKMTAATLTDRQLDVLRSLEYWFRDGWTPTNNGWCTPMDVGGRDQSHHARTLGQLVTKKLVETTKLHAIHCMHGSTYRYSHGTVSEGHKPYEGCSCKGSRRYRITDAGIAALKQRRSRDAQNQKRRTAVQGLAPRRRRGRRRP